MYAVLKPFIQKGFSEAQIAIEPCETLGSVKANVYGYPNMLLRKAVKSCEADYFIRLSFKDIGIVSGPQNQADPSLNLQRKEVRLHCKISLYDEERVLVKEGVGEFESGEKIPAEIDLGVDLRQFRGTGREQELKVYESCSKMAFLRALNDFTSK